MKQKTYVFNSIEEMEKAAAGILDDPAYREACDRVLLTWAQIWDKDDFAAYRESVYRLFPDCTTIGSNHYSNKDILENRLDGTGTDHSIILSFFLFNKSGASLCAIDPGMRQEERQGRELCDFLDRITDARGMYLVPSDYSCSPESIMAMVLTTHKDIPVFGIKTAVVPEYDNFGYSANGDLKSHRVFALVFRGDRLRIRVHYNLGWTPVGKIMTVTKEENPFFVDEIDNRPATEVYNKYLGLKNEQITPENLSEFPIIVQRNGMKISRVSIIGPKAGQLMFGAPVYPDERISLSYGNPDDILNEIRDDSIAVNDFKPQAGLIIACSIRVVFLKNREHEEIDFYKKCMESPAAVYGYGEIYYQDGNGGELNSALLSVAFREDDGSEAASVNTVNDTDLSPVTEGNSGPDPYVAFSDRMTRFFKEVSNDLLMTAREAETANRAKSAFYSAISHEIRTLLNSILGMNEMILNESHEDDIRQYAENASASGRMLLDLINDILDTEKIEAGKMKIVPVDYDPGKVIKELVDVSYVPASNKGLKLSLVKEGDFPPVLIGDSKRLKQCALNLLSNAVKYTEKGEVVLRVTCRPVDEKHVKLRIGVKDTGIGIRPEDIEKLSIPFERVDQSRNHNIEGTGLGLNIVRNLLELMGSSLNIESTYGEGSEFSFSVEQEIKAGDAESNGSGEAVSEAALAQKKISGFRAPDSNILIVDDTPSNIKIMQLFLKESQIQIDSATSGLAAIDMVKQKKYDLIFLDHMMPGMDGLETFGRIKEDTGSPNADSVFIMLTANNEAGVREMFLNEGFDDFITKPLQRNALIETLAKYLKK